jgi:hypothetical protein
VAELLSLGGSPHHTDMPPEQASFSDEPAEPLRLLCMGCKHWAEVGSHGPMYVFTEAQGLGMFKPEDTESRKAGVASAGFMYRHMTTCKRAVAAIRESDPRWVTLDETLREYDTHAA